MFLRSLSSHKEVWPPPCAWQGCKLALRLRAPELGFPVFSAHAPSIWSQLQVVLVPVLLVFNIHRNTDNGHTGLSVLTTLSPFGSEFAPPSSSVNQSSLASGRAGAEGWRVSCPALEGPGQDKFSYSTKSLQDSILRTQTGKAPESCL